MTRVDRFTWERALLADADVTAVRLAVLLALATYMGPNGDEARPGHATLAQAVGVTDRTVRGHLAAAVDAGWLEVASRGHRRGTVGVASTYLATTPPRTPVQDDTPTGSPVPVGPVAQDDQGRRTDPQPEAPFRLVSVPTGADVPVETVDNPPQPEAPRAPTGSHVPPTNQDQETTPPYPPNASPATPESEEGKVNMVDDALDRWAADRYRHTERTTGVRNPDGLRRLLATEAEEHRARAIELAARCPTASAGQLASILHGNTSLLRALESTTNGAQP